MANIFFLVVGSFWSYFRKRKKKKARINQECAKSGLNGIAGTGDKTSYFLWTVKAMNEAALFDWNHYSHIPSINASMPFKTSQEKKMNAPLSSNYNLNL